MARRAIPYNAECGSPAREGRQTEPSCQIRLPAWRKRRAIVDPKRNRTIRAAAAHTSANLLTWGYFAAAMRTFREGEIAGKLATARADRKAADGQPPA